jgi:hypothetical protein
VSKKEIRRAARDAFPKAKRSSTTKGKGKSGAYGRRASGSSGSAPSRPTVRPPSIKRSLIFGVIVAFLYFAFLQWGLKGATTWTNAFFALVGVFLFTGVNYWVERFKYQRHLRKQNERKDPPR